MTEDINFNRLKLWANEKLEIHKEYTVMLSGPNSLYENYTTFMEEIGVTPLLLKPFCTLVMLHVALRENFILSKTRTAKGIKITGCRLHFNRDSNPNQDGFTKRPTLKTEIECAAR